MLKRLILCCLAAGLFIACSDDESVKKKDITKEDLKDTTNLMSYILGFNYGNTIMKDSIKIDTDVFMQGFFDGFENDSLLNREEIASAMKSLNEMLQEEQRKLQAEQIKKVDSLTRAFES
ncbi:MAG: FKBP-type peptidyl-prolyl cis-trans isomerase N-terminal domain-containing protein, partial [Bacteroidota bacterium]